MPIAEDKKFAEYGQITQMALVDTYIKDDGKRYTRDSLRLTPSAGAIWYMDVDLGFPEIRSVTTNFTDSDGVFDETRYSGSRSISLNFIVLDKAYGPIPVDNDWTTDIDWNSAEYWISRLSAWLSPLKRPALYIRFRGDGDYARWIDLRPSGMGAPLTMNVSEHREVQLQFVSPSGKMYSFDESPLEGDRGGYSDGRTFTRVQIQASASVTGRAYPEAYPRNYPFSSATGGNSVRYLGNVPNGFTALIHAGGTAMVNPRLTFFAPDGTIREIGFNYTLAANKTIEIDTVNRTAYLVSFGAYTLLNQYLTAPLSWPLLYPGVNIHATGISGYNSVNFAATSSGSDSSIEILHYNAFIL